MVMDLLRSCYTTEMRFFNDNPLAIKVQWYFARPLAMPFPEPHLFGSGNWASDRFFWPGPGEVLGAARPYSDGSIGNWFEGQRFAGPLKGFTEGTEYPGVPLNASETGGCCACDFRDCSCGQIVDAAAWRNVMRVTIEELIGAGPLCPFSVGQVLIFTRTPGSYTWVGPSFTTVNPVGPQLWTWTMGCYGGGSEPNGPTLDLAGVTAGFPGAFWDMVTQDPRTWVISAEDFEPADGPFWFDFEAMGFSLGF